MKRTVLPPESAGSTMPACKHFVGRSLQQWALRFQSLELGLSTKYAVKYNGEWQGTGYLTTKQLFHNRMFARWAFRAKVEYGTVWWLTGQLCCPSCGNLRSEKAGPFGLEVHREATVKMVALCTESQYAMRALRQKRHCSTNP